MSSSPDTQEQREKNLPDLLSHDTISLYTSSAHTHWILHSKLLCHHSPFLRRIFYPSRADKSRLAASNPSQPPPTKNPEAYGLPETSDEVFRVFVVWLYAGKIDEVKDESGLSLVLELYVLAEQWEVKKLVLEILEKVRGWYAGSDTYPSLRRVQFIYESTGRESPMRGLMIGCMARMLVLDDGKVVPKHWEAALRRNGELGVDLILAVRGWGLSGESVPDVRQKEVKQVVEDAEGREEVRRERGEEVQERHDEKIGHVEEVKLTNGI